MVTAIPLAAAYLFEEGEEPFRGMRATKIPSTIDAITMSATVAPMVAPRGS